MRLVLAMLAVLCVAGAAYAQPEREYFGYRFGMSEAEARAVTGESWLNSAEIAPTPDGAFELWGSKPRVFGDFAFMTVLHFEGGRLARIALVIGGPATVEQCAGVFHDVVVTFESEFGVFDGAPAPEEHLGDPTIVSTLHGSQLRNYAHPELGQVGFANARREHFISVQSAYRPRPLSHDPGRPPCTAQLSIEPRAPESLVQMPPPPAAQALARAPAFERAEWLQRPNGEDFARHYPSWALEAGQEGRVVLDCIVLESGRINCAITSENPEGMGFGEAARAVSQAFLAPAAIDGVATAGKRIIVPISFRMAN